MSLKGDPVAHKVIFGPHPFTTLEIQTNVKQTLPDHTVSKPKCVRRLSKASDQPSLLLLIK